MIQDEPLPGLARPALGNRPAQDKIVFAEHVMGPPLPGGLFQAVLTRRFGADICFLCGDSLANGGTEEHVIPRWAQERFNLWNQRLTILNGTSIPYRYLTVPCCFVCNNLHLQPIETAVSLAASKGAAAVRQLGDRTLFLWLGKIFYGLLYRELFLALDRTDPAGGMITDPTLLREFELHHYFLQSCRVPMTFEDDFPASIFIFDIKEIPDPKHGWDFRDHVPAMFISCRVGKVGMIAALQDGGAQRLCDGLYPKLQDTALHPAQFQELTARSLYMTSLATRTPKYIISDGPEYRVFQQPLGGLSTKPFFNPWNQEEFAQLLSLVINVPVDRLFHPPDRVVSWLLWPGGAIRNLTFDEFPWPPSRR